jgi:hypothetical protein
MAKKVTDLKPAIFAKDSLRVAKLRSWVGEVFSDSKRGACLVSVAKGHTPNDLDSEPETIAKVLIVFEDSPVEMAGVDKWRDWAMTLGAWEVHIAFLAFYDGSEEERYRTIVEQCKGWNQPAPKPEKVKIQKGAFVKMSSDPSERNLATLLTMTLGSMGDLLTRAEVLARRFKQGCPQKSGSPDKQAIQSYLGEIDVLLKDDKRDGENHPKLSAEPAPDYLPKLLLRGDSGVGKSLIAGYLHARTGWKGRPLRIPIPEYLGKEDMFEYDLFGYCKGAYTDGKEDGSRGLLLSNAGRVVFLDEIGEANEYLQAKLLAFLDDYRVRPRGWEGEPFYCPVLVVAATNKDLEEMVQRKKFRGDLLARFTDRHRIPGLNERIGDLPFILDCLLQRPAMNPGIETIGEKAYDAIRKLDFKKENFRGLENLFRAACERALRDGRTYLVEADIVAHVAAQRC